MDNNFEKLNLNPKDSFIGNPGAWMVKKWEREFKEKLDVVEDLHEEEKSVLKIIEKAKDQSVGLETVKNEYIDYLRKNFYSQGVEGEADMYLREYIKNDIEPIVTKGNFEIALRGHLSTIEKHLRTLFEIKDPSPN